MGGAFSANVEYILMAAKDVLEEMERLPYAMAVLMVST
jgi:hypothetical protein